MNLTFTEIKKEIQISFSSFMRSGRVITQKYSAMGMV